MAENEILDVRGRFRRKSRELLNSNQPLADVVRVLTEEWENELLRNLHKAFQAGQTLQELLRAAEKGHALAAVVQTFKPRTLAQICRQAIENCRESPTPEKVAAVAADVFIARSIGAVLTDAAMSPLFADARKLSQLETTVRREFENRRPAVVAKLQQSLLGVKSGSPVRRQKRPPLDARAKSLLGTSLVSPSGAGNGTRRPH